MTVDLSSDHDLALQLHTVLVEIDPARFQSQMTERLRRRLRPVLLALKTRPQHAALAEKLSDELPSLGSERRAWLAFKKRLHPVYLDFERRLKSQSIRVPTLRPTNYWRSLFHVTSSLVAVIAVELLFSPTVLLAIALAWAALAWTFEIARRQSPWVNTQLMRFFGPVAHAHEAERVNSATWFATALVPLALTHSTLLCVTAAIVLGVGDPCAALIGRRFGRHRLQNGRSLEGAAAFAVSASLATGLVLTLFHQQLGFAPAALVSLSAGCAGSIAELVSGRVDDNLSIPLSAAAAAALVMLSLGMTL